MDEPAARASGIRRFDIADRTALVTGSSRGLGVGDLDIPNSALAVVVRVVMLGLLLSGEQPVLASLITTRELELVGSFRFNDEMDEVIEALVEGSLLIDPVITDEYPVEDGLAAFERAGNGAVLSKVLLRF